MTYKSKSRHVLVFKPGTPRSVFKEIQDDNTCRRERTFHYNECIHRIALNEILIRGTPPSKVWPFKALKNFKRFQCELCGQIYTYLQLNKLREGMRRT